MNHVKYFFFIILCITLVGCKNRHNAEDASEAVSLTEQSITAFAKDIEKGIINGKADALNNVIDKANIKRLVGENSIVYSGFDVEGGQEYFENCLNLGSTVFNIVNTGGDFAFSKYYCQDNIHHIVFRSYDNFVVNFYDFTVDTVQGKLMIQDGFIYNTGCLLSQNIQGGMLYNLMLQTNPDSDVQWLAKAEEMTQLHQGGKALSILNEHKDALKEYPIFYQLYIANLYQNNSGSFISKLDELQNELDERYILLHKLLFYVNAGKVKEAEATINALIPHTGDDPIFLFLFGYTHLNNKDFQSALDCFKTVDKSMPYVWDLWQCELQCYKALNDSKGLEQCLQRGKSAYGMSDAELEEHR